MKKYLFLSILFPVFFKGQVSPLYFNLFKSTTAHWWPSDNIRLANGNKVISAMFSSGTGVSTGGGTVANFNGPNSVLWAKTIDQPYNMTRVCENGTGIYAFFEGPHAATGIMKLNAANGNIVWSKAYNNSANPLFGPSSTPSDVMLLKENTSTAVFFNRTDTNGVYHSFLMKIDANGNVLFSKRIDSIYVNDVVKAGTDYILMGNKTFPGPVCLVSVDASYNVNWSKKISYAQPISPYLLSFQNNTIYLSGGAQNNCAVLQAFNTTGNLLLSKSYYSTTPNVTGLAGTNVIYKNNHLHVVVNVPETTGYYEGVMTLDMNGVVIKNRLMKYGTSVQLNGDHVGIAPDTAVFFSGTADMGGVYNAFQMQFDPEGDLEMCVPDSIAIADSALTSVVSAGQAYAYVNDATTFANISLPLLAESVVPQGFHTVVDSLVPTPAPCAQACQGMMTVYFSGIDGNPNVQWSANTGSQTTTDAFNLCPGTYSVTLTDMFGCSASSGSGLLGSALPQTPDICMVTVDSVGTTNYIYWDKSAYSPTDTFIVYRDTANNNYARIGKVPFDSLSQFADTVRSLYAANGDPTVSSWRYKIAVRDSCGNYGAMSPYHQTMFFQNSVGNFSWNHYQIEGQITPVPTLSNYRFKRDDISTGVWNTIQLLSASSTAYTDPSYGTYQTTASWRVETQWSTTCTPALKLTPEAMAAVAKSRSNVQNNFAVTGIKTITEKDFVLMPNPANDFIVIQSKSTMKNVVVEVYDLTGRLVLTSPTISLLSAGAFSAKEGFQHSININTSGLSNGIYSVRIISDNFKITKKLAVEK